MTCQRLTTELSGFARRAAHGTTRQTSGQSPLQRQVRWRCDLSRSSLAFGCDRGCFLRCLVLGLWRVARSLRHTQPELSYRIVPYRRALGVFFLVVAAPLVQASFSRCSCHRRMGLPRDRCADPLSVERVPGGRLRSRLERPSLDDGSFGLAMLSRDATGFRALRAPPPNDRVERLCPPRSSWYHRADERAKSAPTTS